MFNCDALQQLKQDLHANKETSQGIVRGTSKRFGFVILEDGREAFLNPDEMQRVFPGDCVEVILSSNNRDQLEATLEKLVSSELNEFVGRYTVRGKGHFIEPDLPNLSRWIFLAPQNRLDALNGDYIRAQITKHPFNCEGKAQAKVLQRIGQDQDIAIEAKYTQNKFQLPFHFSDTAQQQAAELEGKSFSAREQRRDLTHMPFVTIDAETTLDMDDALYAERLKDKQGNGWKLWVAIADPSSEINLGSALALAAKDRASSIYLPANTLTMLPKPLSYDTFSLLEQKSRPALICEINITEDGTINQFCFYEALIQSRQKLSYSKVASLLEQPDTPSNAAIDTNIASSLQQLSNLSYARTRYRQDHALVMEEQPNYQLILNDLHKIERIDKCERTLAHALVEEAMLACNICAGNFFAQNPGYGLFSTHAGFKTTRLEEVKSLLKDDCKEIIQALDINHLDSLSGYQALISNLQRKNANCKVLAALKRTLQPGQLSLEAKPHMGLGFKHYATITSPIRRYHDFYNHHCIKAIIQQLPVPKISKNEIKQLQRQLITGRQACRQMEQWLYSQYMLPFTGQIFRGKISLITAAGLGIKLIDSGIQGFCFLAGNRKNKPKFDSRRIKMTYNEQGYYLDQKIDVKIDNIDIDKRKINMSLIATKLDDN